MWLRASYRHLKELDYQGSQIGFNSRVSFLLVDLWFSGIFQKLGLTPWSASSNASHTLWGEKYTHGFWFCHCWARRTPWPHPDRSSCPPVPWFCGALLCTLPVFFIALKYSKSSGIFPFFFSFSLWYPIAISFLFHTSCEVLPESTIITFVENRTYWKQHQLFNTKAQESVIHCFLNIKENIQKPFCSWENRLLRWWNH